MKNVFKYLAAMVMGFALTGMVSCGDDPEPEPTQDPTPNNVDPTVQSGSYVFHYMDRDLEPGQTVYYYPTQEQAQNKWAEVVFYIENKTDANLETVMKVERISGPEAFDDMTICFGESCKNGTCPWTSAAFSLVPGVNDEMPIKVEYDTRNAAEPGVYQITVGKGAAMADPQVMYLWMTDQPQPEPEE